VLEIAANADPAVAERLRVEALDEHDPELRDLLLRVVGGLDDPKRHHAMLDRLVPDPKITAEDIVAIFGSGDVDAQLDSEAYIRAHFDDLMRRMPASENEDFPIALGLSRVFVATCDASSRDDVVAFLNAHFATIPSGARPVKQLIEGLDHCIARRQLLEPSVRAWLGAKGSR
jgi:alanyl aminopeptidase